MRRILAALLLVFCGSVAAQTVTPPPLPPCKPWENNDKWFAMVVGYNLFGGPGPFLVYHCYSQIIPEGSLHAPLPIRVTIAQPWSSIDLTKLGSRIDTIRKSANPTRAFEIAWKRYVTLPMSDPSLAQVAAAASAVR